MGGAGRSSITNTQNAGGAGILIDAGKSAVWLQNTGLVQGGNSSAGARNQATSPTAVQMSGKVDASNSGTILGGRANSPVARGSRCRLVGDSTLVGFTGQDVIDFLDVAATSLSFAGDILILEDGSQTVGTLHFASGYSLNNFP